MLTLNLSAVDAATIHRAIHHQPLAASVATTEQGILFIEPNSYGNGSVALPNGVRAVGANPVKDSQYGRKMRAGSAVTLFNPQGSKQFESRCVVIESLSAIARPTVVSGLHFNLPHILEDLRGTACDPASATLNVGDPSRMRDDASLKANEALLVQSGKIKKRSRAHEVDLIDIAKVGSAACRSCEVKIPKGALRFGFVRVSPPQTISLCQTVDAVHSSPQRPAGPSPTHSHKASLCAWWRGVPCRLTTGGGTCRLSTFTRAAWRRPDARFPRSTICPP